MTPDRVVTDLSRAITEADLLEVERELRAWLVRIVFALIAVIVSLLVLAVSVGIAYGGLRGQVMATTARIEEVRAEGSLPLSQMRIDMAVIKEQQRANTTMIQAIANKLRVVEP